MLLTIANGAQKNIEVGSLVKINADFTPKDFTANTQFAVTKLEEYNGVWYPFVIFNRIEQRFDEHTQSTFTEQISEESAISLNLITDVQA